MNLYGMAREPICYCLMGKKDILDHKKKTTTRTGWHLIASHSPSGYRLTEANNALFHLLPLSAAPVFPPQALPYSERNSLTRFWRSDPSSASGAYSAVGAQGSRFPGLSGSPNSSRIPPGDQAIFCRLRRGWRKRMYGWRYYFQN